MAEEQTPETFPGQIWESQIHYGQTYEQGTKFTYHIYLPPTALEQGKDAKLALHVLLEHTFDPMCHVMTSLMGEGLIPPGLVLFVYPGVLEPTLPQGDTRNMRTQEFDEVSREFSDLIVEELVPEACKTAGVTLDPSPDMHFITGGSSGGTMAFNAVWFRNDYFHRAFLSSPTFAAERGGESILPLVRKCESRPIRMYMTVGTEEPAGVDGSSLYCALDAAEDFEFAGYDFRFEQFNGEGHCCRRQDPGLWRRVARFVWYNWRRDPVVRTLYPQNKISAFLEPETFWEEYAGKMPYKQAQRTKNGSYTFDGGKIYLVKDGKRKLVASGFDPITALRISADRWRLYIAVRGSRYLFAMSILPDGTLTQKHKLAPLHLLHDCHYLGADDLTVMEDNRVLAATELGIQGLAPTGMVNLILPLPGDLPAHQVVTRAGYLYAASGDKVFRRKLREKPFIPLRGWSMRSHLLP